MSILLKNPHSVLATLEARPKDVLSINIPQAGATDAWEKVAKLARELKVPVTSGKGGGIGKSGPAPRGPSPRGSSKDSRDSRVESTRLSVSEATVREKPSISAEELFQNAAQRSKGRGLWLALDNLQDPHNVGAIFRSAAFFGIEGILLTQDRSASMTGIVYDVAAGGVEEIPYSQQVNLQQAFRIAKDAGIWVLGSSEHAQDDFRTVQRDRPWLLVLGNEEKGMRRLTEESCDVLCQITKRGELGSLNVSVAAGILMAQLKAQ